MFSNLSNLILAGTRFGASSQINQNATSTWLTKAVAIGGTAVIFSYAGYRLWQCAQDNKRFNSITPKTLLGNEAACSSPKTENRDVKDNEMSDFEFEDDFTLPVGASWADICPEVTEEVEVDALYQLPEVEEYEEDEIEEKRITAWGLDVIEEE